MLIFSIALALVFQYPVASQLVDSSKYSAYIRKTWLDGCEHYNNIDLQKSCAGNNGVYRVTGAATLFFLLAAIAVALKPTANREAWPAKYILFTLLCGITVFIPNEPLFSGIYLNIARIGGIMFIFLQQLIILDVAYDWNDSWVEKANAAEAEQAGSGKKWLGAILASCVILFSCAIAGISLLFVYFTGCSTNNAFISITLILGIFIVFAQLTGQEGSLLSSACIFAWAVFLCHIAVSKNPKGECNPKLGHSDNLSIALGLLITIISLAWTGWSWTAEDKLNYKKTEPAEEAPSSANEAEPKSRKVSGVVTGQEHDEEEGKNGDDTDEDNIQNNPQRLSNSWKLNFILAVISCWMATALTSWGTVSANGDAANPQVGETGMWMVIASQWLVLSLYLWTLVAPKLFPGRDFS